MYSPIISPGFRAPCVAALLLMVSGCAADLAGPAPESGPVLAGSSIAARATGPAATRPSALRPNALKYRDAGARPVKVRSGDVTMAVRALLARDGSTLVEATTGDFEGAAATGDLTSVQLKHLLDGGWVTRNFPDLTGGGYWAQEVDGLLHDGPVQLQGKLRESTGKRTHVLKAETRVVRRPDLGAGSFQAPAQADVDRLVTISAVIAELNGDVGARADCVLFVDGAPVHASRGIWVDAGDAVTCTFDTKFSTPGTRQVAIAAVGVAPGDWDDANNAATGTIEVRSGVPSMRWALEFEGYDRSFDYEMNYEGYGMTLHRVRKGSDYYRDAWLSASTAEARAFQGDVVFAASFTSGGLPVGQATVAGQRIVQADMECHAGWDDSTGTSIRVCSYAGSPVRDLWASHSSTRVTYFGEDVINGTGYRVDADDTEGFGAFAVGSTFGMDVQVTDAAGLVARVAAITPVTQQVMDMLCRDGGWEGATCTGFDRKVSYAGSAAGP